MWTAAARQPSTGVVIIGSATLVDLAGILGLAAKVKGLLETSDDAVVECRTLVAGARNTLCLLLFALARIGPK